MVDLWDNPMGTDGFEFVEYTGPEPAQLAALFERMAAYGRHLDIPAGTAVRFEPGETKEVALVPYGGARWISGFHGFVGGSLDGAGVKEKFEAALSKAGFDSGKPK